MTELLSETFTNYKTKTGKDGLCFLGFSFLFFFFLIADILYAQSTQVTNIIKGVGIFGMGYYLFKILGTTPSKKKKLKRMIIKREVRHAKKIKIVDKAVTPLPSSPESRAIMNPESNTAGLQSVSDEISSQHTQDDSGPKNFVLTEIRRSLQEKQNKERALKQREFFTTKEGAQNRKDRLYLGVNIADIVKISSEYAKDVTLADIAELVDSEVHDERIIAIWLLINSYKASSTENKQAIYDFYLQNRTSVDNWDMVDLAARNIIGTHIVENTSHKVISDELINSGSVWDKRTAVMSAHPLVLAGDLGYGFSVAERLIDCPEELVQSSLGWVLKEAYKQDAQATEGFIKSHFQSLSKQAIRIGTERMEKNYRKAFLRGEFEPVRV